MEIIKQLLSLIIQFLADKKQKEIESQEKLRLEIETKNKINKTTPPTKSSPDNFFGD